MKSDYDNTLTGVIPHLRNALAHPRMHSIAIPVEAFFQLRLTAEFINQLFAPGSATVTGAGSNGAVVESNPKSAHKLHRSPTTRPSALARGQSFTCLSSLAGSRKSGEDA